MNSSYRPESELLRDCIQGSKAAWDEFVERYSKLVYWSIHKTLGTSQVDNSEFIREIFQDIFSKLVEKETLSQIRNSEGLSTFIVVLSCRITLDRLKYTSRREKRYISEEDIQNVDSAVTADSTELILSEEVRKGLTEALQVLTPREKACLEFHYFEEKTHSDIARLMDIPIDTVSTLIRRTREKVKAYLLQKGYADF